MEFYVKLLVGFRILPLVDDEPTSLGFISIPARPNKGSFTLNVDPIFLNRSVFEIFFESRSSLFLLQGVLVFSTLLLN